MIDLKEKLGGLRVQVETPAGGTLSTIAAAIRDAEADAVITCEFCGNWGRARTRGDRSNGWVKTVCESCHGEWSTHQILIVKGEDGCRSRSRPGSPWR